MRPVFVHVALDEYGARACGRLQHWLEVEDYDDARHAFVWAGFGAEPTRSGFWMRDVPDWTARFHLPLHGEHAAALNLDRSALAASSAESYRNDWPRVQAAVLRPAIGEGDRGEPSRVVVAIAGCLGNTATSAHLIGFLSALARLRGSGAAVGTSYVIAGIGADPFTDVLEPAQSRALAGQSLRDLEGFLGAGNARLRGFRSAPVYLVGETDAGGSPIDSAARVALAAMTMEGVVEHEVAEGGNVTGVSPFYFTRRVDGRVDWGAPDRDLDAERPFAVAGGCRVEAAGERLQNVAALQICREAFERLLADATPVKSTSPSRAEVTDGSSPHRLLASLEEEIFEAVQVHFGRPAPDRDVGQSGGAGLARSDFDALVAGVADTKAWERLFSLFGEARFRSLRPTRWHEAVDDLKEIVAGSMKPERARALATVLRVLSISFLVKLESAVGTVFRHTWTEAVGTDPSRVAGLLLKKLARTLDEESEQLVRAALTADRPDAERTSRMLQNLEREIFKAVDALPTRIAVVLRVVPVALMGLLIGRVIPFPGILPDTVLTRLVVGGMLAVVGLIAVWVRYVDTPRSRAKTAVREWLAAYQLALMAEDETARRATLAKLAATLRECVDWFTEGQADPPIPAYVGPIRETPPPDALELLRASADRVDVHAPLNEPAGMYEPAGMSFADAEVEVRAGLHPSRVELVLPDVDAETRELEERVERLIGEAPERPAMTGFMQDICATADESPIGCAPYRASRHPAGASIWRYSFVLPSQEQLLLDEVRDQSVAWCFFRTTRDRVTALAGGGSALPDLLRRSTDGPAGPIAQLISARSLLSARVDTARGHEILVHSTAGGDDPLKGRLSDETQTTANEAPRQHCALLRIRMGLSAEEVIYYPNRGQPADPLGIACRAQETGKWTEPLWNPIEISPEVEE